MYICIYVDAVAESERNPVNKHQIQAAVSIENEQADAGRHV